MLTLLAVVAAQTTRTGNAALSADENSSEIRDGPFIRARSCQSGASSLQPRKFQAEPCRRAGKKGPCAEQGTKQTEISMIDKTVF